jgi:hypothetical protein
MRLIWWIAARASFTWLILRVSRELWLLRLCLAAREAARRFRLGLA